MTPTSTSAHMLPSVDQKWAHSVVSQERLEEALLGTNDNAKDPITALETDIVWGHDTTLSSSLQSAILAHPPDTSSDLSLERFLQRTVRDTSCHLKLDFKTIEAVGPSLALVRKVFAKSTTTKRRTVFWNADIVPGPGRTWEDLTVPASDFLQACRDTVSSNNTWDCHLAYSLGWKVDVCWPFGYSTRDIQAMLTAMEQIKDDVSNNGTTTSALPVVWAVNARLLAKTWSIQPFVDFLISHTSQDRQLLIWTGSGEPPIGRHILQRIESKIKNVLCDKQKAAILLKDQIGYDVQIEEDWKRAWVYDIVMYVLGWKNICLSYWKHIRRYLAITNNKV